VILRPAGPVQVTSTGMLTRRRVSVRRSIPAVARDCFSWTCKAFPLRPWLHAVAIPYEFSRLPLKIKMLISTWTAAFSAIKTPFHIGRREVRVASASACVVSILANSQKHSGSTACRKTAPAQYSKRSEQSLCGLNPIKERLLTRSSALGMTIFEFFRKPSSLRCNQKKNRADSAMSQRGICGIWAG
jgi:hypothetical protein